MAFTGAALWLGAALLLQALAPQGVHQGAARVVMYLAIIPGTWPFVLLLKRVAGLARGQVLPGVAVALMVATLLDGLALAFIPGLYGSSLADTAGAGAVILWGAGVFLALAMLADRR
jgi:hypothetical protein